MATRPRITSSRPQPITGRGRITYQPRTLFESRGVPALLAQAARRRPTLPGYTPPPAAAPGAPAAPATPAAPQYSLDSLPPDASYDAAIGLLQRQRDEQQAAITGERTRGLLDYGFTEAPGGALAVDPNSPWSKAALLKQTHDRSRAAAGTSMAAGGQLYSGAYQNAQDTVNRNELQAQDQLQKALINFLARNTQQTRQAGTGYELAAAQAYGDRVGRFQTNPLYDPAANPEPITPAPSPAGMPAAAASTSDQIARFIAARRRNPRGVWGR